MHADLSILNFMLVLAAALVAGGILNRLGLPAILGELLAGVLLGPPLLGLIHSSGALDVLAQVGVLLMMFYAGLEIDPEELGKASLGGLLAAAGGFLVPFGLGYLTVRLFGGPVLAGILVGNVLGITSLTANSRILLDLKLLDTRVAHVLMAGALVADTFGLMFFAGLTGVVQMGDPELLLILEEAGKAILFLLFTAATGIWVFPIIGRFLWKRLHMSRGLLFTLGLVVALLFGEFAELAGLHAILGTFLVGMFMRNAIPDRRLTRDLIELVHDVSLGFLAPVFFIIAGFEVSLGVFTTDLGMLLAIVGVAMVGKILGAALFYLPTGHGWREGLTIGAGMNGHAAVEIIIAEIALEMGIIDQGIFSILVVMAILTTTTVPILLKVFTGWLKQRGELIRSEQRKGVLIVGAGPTARLLAEKLSESQPVHLVDSNQRLCSAARREGLEVVCGNALKEEVLAQAQAAHVKTLVTLTSNSEVNVLTAQLAREVFLVPEVHVTLMGRTSEAHEELIDPLKATTLFAGPADVTAWDRRVDQDQYDIIMQPIDDDEITAREVISRFESSDRGLPLIIHRADGSHSLFHAGTDLEAGDNLMVLVPKQDNKKQDDFDRLVREATILDIGEPVDMEEFFQTAAARLAEECDHDPAFIMEQLLQREREGSTVLGPDLAVPHILLEEGCGFHLLIARCRQGVFFPDMEARVHIVFVLAGGTDERTLHLRSLSAIAQIIQTADFEERWLDAEGREELRRLILDAERRRL